VAAKAVVHSVFTMSTESISPGFTSGRRAGALTFGALFSLESFIRSLNITVISLQAHDLLKASQRVSELSVAVSLSVLVTTLSMPYILGRLRRRWAYSLGIASMIMACLFLASYSIPGQALGMYFRNCGAAILNVTLSLYILDHIKKADLAHTEPLRLSLSTVSWSAGPALGVWLYTAYGPWGPQLASIATALILLCVFWYLRLADRSAFRPGTLQGFNPLANVRRFAGQPRLRLAWLIAFGRSCFWATLFIYGPLLLIEAHVPNQMSGLMISASQAMLFGAYGFGRLARHFGVRIIIYNCFFIISVACLATGLAGREHPYAAMALLLAGSAAATGLDGVGGIPFLRAVRYHERQRMAAVYRTFIDLSELLPAIVFAVALRFFEIGVVFTLLGVGLAAIGFVSWRYLPKSL
jgi:MFS family permease